MQCLESDQCCKTCGDANGKSTSVEDESGGGQLNNPTDILSGENQLLTDNGIRISVYFTGTGYDKFNAGSLRINIDHPELTFSSFASFLFYLSEHPGDDVVNYFNICIKCLESNLNKSWNIPISNIRCVMNHELIRSNAVLHNWVGEVLREQPENLIILVYDDPLDIDNYVLFPMVADTCEEARLIIDAIELMTETIKPHWKNNQNNIKSDASSDSGRR